MKNIKIIIKLFLCFLFLVTSINFSYAEKVSDLKIDKYVNDYANIVDDNVEADLEKSLYDFFASTTHQIVVVTVNDIDNDYIEHYSIKLAEKIKAGNAKNDNGILVLVSKNDRQMRIEVGYGLEEVMTDGKSSYIVNKIMTPNFKNGDYTQGITEGVKEIKKISGDKNYDTGKGDGNILSKFFKGVPADILFFSSIFLLVFLSTVMQWVVSVLGRTKSWWLGGVAGLVVAVIIFFLFVKVIWIFVLGVVGLIFDYFVSKNYKEHKIGEKDGPADWWSGGSWGPGSSGGWGGGYSSSGGGFSGGGGSFGGGGSSGSW